MTLIQELRKPYNLITFILTIFSILISFYFYFKAEKEKALSFNIQEPTSLIFDSKKSVSTITIYEKDSVPIRQNIYLLTGTIWNTGDYPIYKSDLRQPLSISLKTSNRILDYKINKQKDNAIAYFTLKKIDNSNINIDWKYFDPNYGFKFQVIYVGDSDSGIKLKGKILDISEFEQIEITKEIDPYSKYISLVVMLLALINGVFVSKKMFRKNPIDIRLRILNGLLVLVPLIGIGYIVVKYFINNNLPEF
jgi:hypothetical protein